MINCDHPGINFNYIAQQILIKEELVFGVNQRILQL